MQSTTSTSLQDSQQGGSSTTTTHSHHLSPSPTTTRSGSTKRPLSPSSASPSLVPEKSLKKSPTTIEGFSKLPLPITFPPLTSPSKTTLNRTMSEPISNFNQKNAPFSPFSATSPSSAHFLKPQFQETTKSDNFLGSTPSKALHKLLRSISDPTTLSFGETPSSQRVEKMKGIIKGISQLCDEVISEEEEKENEEYGEDITNQDTKKDCSESVNHENIGEDGQEAVSVEKKGDSLVVHFNCPCGIDYEILLSGNNCYYRLA